MINKLRALNSWYTKGLDNGSHLRVAINSATSIRELRDVIQAFFAQADVTRRTRSAGIQSSITVVVRQCR